MKEICEIEIEMAFKKWLAKYPGLQVSVVIEKLNKIDLKGITTIEKQWLKATREGLFLSQSSLAKKTRADSARLCKN